jgi:hypothetical protein
MGYSQHGKKSEQRKTFNLKISHIDEDGNLVSKRYFTKHHACREEGLSYISITRILRGEHVAKFAHLKIESIKEPAQLTTFVQLYE